MLCDLAYWYGSNSQEDEMRFVHFDFLVKMWNKCFEVYPHISKEMKMSLVKSIGRSKFRTESTLNILKQEFKGLI